jgi:hypothetical protein
MSFKSWSSAQNSVAKDTPDDKSKDVPSADPAVARPGPTPVEVMPTVDLSSAQPDDKPAKDTPKKES